MKHRIFLCACVLVYADPAVSDGLDYALRGGVAYSDNVERVPSGLERSSSTALIGLEMRGARPKGRLRYNVAADVAYNEYLNDDIDAELLGRAALEGAYDFVPDAISWNASFDYDQIRRDIQRPLAPGNVDDQITFSTGPTFRARFSNLTELQFDGRYERLSYAERPFDNETLSARIQFGRRANPNSLLAIGASYDDVSFLSGAGASGLDYDRRELFSRLEFQGARTSIGIELGYADISGRLVDDGGPMVRARVSRKLTPSLSAFINAVREYPTSDATPLSLDPTISGGGAIDNSLLSTGPRKTMSFEGGLRFERTRTQADVAYLWHEEESVVSSGKREYQEVRTRLTRIFAPRVRGTVYGALTSENQPTATQSVEERIAGMELGITVGRALAIDVRMEHRDRDGDISELSGGVFLRYFNSL